MSDLISRAAAIDAVKDRYYKYGRFAKVEELAWAIEALPSAQPEIIRCKDCKKYDMHGHRCKHWNHGVVVMDWCSKAERR